MATRARRLAMPLSSLSEHRSGSVEPEQYATDDDLATRWPSDIIRHRRATLVRSIPTAPQSIPAVDHRRVWAGLAVPARVRAVERLSVAREYARRFLPAFGAESAM